MNSGNAEHENSLGKGAVELSDFNILAIFTTVQYSTLSRSFSPQHGNCLNTRLSIYDT